MTVAPHLGFKSASIRSTSSTRSVGKDDSGAPRRDMRPNEIGLLNDAAHELRSPLACLRGYGDLIADGRVAGDELRVLGERIRLQARRLSETVDDILELAQIDAHRGANFNLHPHPVERLIADALDALGPERSERVEVLVPEHPLPALWVDRSKLTRALLNLLDNACKYSPAHAPVILRVGLRGGSPTNPKHLSFHVRDHGTGISPEDTRRVFDRFFRAARTSELPGSGLGLPISRQIAQLHHGALRLRSQLGAGTIASLVLPLRN